VNFMVRLSERLGFRRHPRAIAFDVWAQRVSDVAAASGEAAVSGAHDPSTAQEMPVLRAIAGYVA
jgi:hypothetical protein